MSARRPPAHYRLEVDCGSEWRWDGGEDRLPSLRAARAALRGRRADGDDRDMQIVRVVEQVVHCSSAPRRRGED